MPYHGKESYYLETPTSPRKIPSQPVDILKQLDRCVAEAKKAEQTGDWGTAEAERHRLNAQISSLDVLDGIRMASQATMGVKALISRNWPGVIYAIASVAALALTAIKRHRSSP